MKLSKKIAVLSTAALLGVAPVIATGVNSSANVQAASSSKVYNTNGKGSITVTKKTNFYDKNGKKLSRTAAKGGKYTIWNVKTINGKLYFSIQTNLKYWLPATATKGTVSYKDGSSTITYTTNGTSTITMTSKTGTTTSKDSSTSSSSKTTTTKKSSTTKTVKITMKRKAYVYDKNGKRVKDYYGTSYIGKGITVNGYGTKTIKGTKYYALEPNKYYVKASDVK
ncbi:SLAP domain-containing protein [Lactobacillus sp.]|uniref:SLAP domain-containing protein n=1 Tax=Lactobacillus sp. TaxID=1591 RepID=UPI00199B66CF|nr:SLAP domain-containing protein [Lactobacillus sp.]MBD5429869.1 hypothetical protein [Lactobacillus sp.]